jgi:hypothetical protein
MEWADSLCQSEKRNLRTAYTISKSYKVILASTCAVQSVISPGSNFAGQHAKEISD